MLNFRPKEQAMDILNAPWRQKYVEKTNEPRTECIFCEILKQDTDQKNLVLERYKYNAVLMNKYPYNAGHLLIIPLKHIDTLEELTPEARAEMMELTSAATAIIKKLLNNQGTNIGINMGKAAGAGIPEHLHMHVVPRWHGDTNFLPVIAGTKQISVDMAEMYQQLKPFFGELLK